LPGSGLCFTQTPGPLLAVVGLCGGAGASTIAYLTAVTAAVQSSVPVLVCDTGGPTAGLAVYAGVTACRTLAEAAERVAGAEPLTGGLFAVDEHGLRVIAGEPQFTVHPEKAGVQRVLNDAREAHGLTVLDGGTLARGSDQTAMGVATHVAWVLPASESAVTRARRVLDRIAPLSRPELLIARSDGGKAPIGALRDLADHRRAPLVLMPRVMDFLDMPVLDVAGEAALTLQAIGGLMRR
jgi:Flp pilus assembly CpaE family ATPase